MAVKWVSEFVISPGTIDGTKRAEFKMAYTAQERSTFTGPWTWNYSTDNISMEPAEYLAAMTDLKLRVAAHEHIWGQPTTHQAQTQATPDLA